MRLVKTVREWGNVYALPLSKREADALGIHPGDKVDIEVEPHVKGIDLSGLPTLPLGSHLLDLDQVAADAALDDLAG